MNIGTLSGFVLIMAVVVGTIFMSFQNISAIFDLHAAIIVIGSTIAVTLVCFPVKRIKLLLGVVLRRILGNNRRDYMSLVAEISALSEAKRKGGKALEGAIAVIKDPFLRDSTDVLNWAKSDVSREEIRDMLEKRVMTHYKLYMNEAKIFRTLAKLVPAFGLMGTTIGMIALLQNLGSADAKSMIGPAMSIALVATLYALVFANFVLIPIAQNLEEQTQEDMIMRSMVVEGIMLIYDEKPTTYIKAKVKSYLLPKDRQDGTPTQKAG